MAKKIVLTGVVVFIAWSAMDYVLHGMLLQNAYKETAALWRPMDEMKNGLLSIVALISALTLVYVYATMVSQKSMANALKYSLILGLGMAVSFAYGSYAVMPVPYSMALSWFLGSLTEFAVAGAIIGLMVKE